MGTWILEKDLRTWAQRQCGEILKAGPLPKHVGFILDGNRRYATSKQLEKIEGHKKGFDKLAESLRWCLDLGITEVTVFVFSIENFRRSSEEVTGLMQLAKEKFLKLLEEEERIMAEGVCVQIVGDWNLVPDDLRPIMAKAMIMTRHNTRAKLNVAFAYTARNEITRGIQELQKGVQEGVISENDICEELINEAFQLLPTAPLGLLVRTSGETRLSDFLLWQSTKTVLCFADVLWPEFTYWHLLSAVLHYQINQISIKLLYLPETEHSSTRESNERRERFIEMFRERKWRRLEEDANSLSSCT